MINNWILPLFSKFDKSKSIEKSETKIWADPATNAISSPIGAYKIVAFQLSNKSF